MDNPVKENTTTYWRQTRRLTLFLLFSWFVLSFGILYFARELAAFNFFGWPLSVYMAAQGLTLFYVVILAIFSVRSHGIERVQKKLLKDSH
ncbi:MAG: DUF4212 domain-containing protein [Undibacterium sp.]|uniref:DUF4212 domain-containing protein n=1 Tax=Undibacterium sp. TaxID=1914977 RepID=UPI0027268FC5|nr:sodium/substrate symporter small subunit [Undibacterium sp.]MDO8653289.1 DUF4212 domain-containing protein [Undibacterium sp.]